MPVARHHPLLCPAGAAALLGAQHCSWPPTLRKRELGVSFSAVFLISFWLWFVLSYMTRQDGLVGRQEGRMVGIQVRIMIPLLPSCSGMALLLHVRWVVLTFAPFSTIEI